MNTKPINTDVTPKYFNYLERIRQSNHLQGRNKDLILAFLRDCELGKTILKGEKKKIGYYRLYKLIGILCKLDGWLQKPFDEVKQEDMDTFILALERGNLTQKNGRPYKTSTQKTIKKIVKKYYKWLLGNNKVYPELVQSIDTYGALPEVKSISKAEVDKLISRAGNINHKFTIATLFDSGCRAAEFFNLQMKDITKKDDYYIIRIRVSKTKPRSISLPLYTSLIDEYLAEHPSKEDPESYLSNLSYDAVKKLLKRLGQKVLQKNLYCHLMRHSSATYYANHLNHYQMCKRYGWSMSSDMPNLYVDTAGVLEEETVTLIRGKTEAIQKKQDDTLRQELNILKHSLHELQEIEEKRRLEQDLHNQLYAKVGTFDNKEGITDLKELLYRVLKSDPKLIQQLATLSST